MGVEQMIYPTTPEDDEIARLRDIIVRQDKTIEKITTELRESRTDQRAMLLQVGEHARARGEAEGILAISEKAVIVEGWRARALAAEVELEELRDILLPFARYRVWARLNEWPIDVAEDPHTPVLGRSNYDGDICCEVTVGHFDLAYWALHDKIVEETP